MICKVCLRMLRGHEGQVWKGTYDLHFEQHKDKNSLELAKEEGCCFCRVIWVHVQKIDQEIEEARQRAPAEPARRNDSNDVDDDDIELSSPLFPRKATDASMRASDPALISASLTAVQGWDSIYRLDFKMRNEDTGFREKAIATFILKRAEQLHAPIRTPRSSNTNSEEVFQLAYHWLRQCERQHTRCLRRVEPGFYPERLVYIENVDDKINPTVRVVYTRDWNLETPDRESHRGQVPDRRYTTISHRWGGRRFLTLTTANEHLLRSGTHIRELPKTFRDAIGFTRRLGLSYIWIDSLCILQRPKEEKSENDTTEQTQQREINAQATRDDWLHQSAVMEKIYGNAFVNLSATAANTSEEGLYFDREPELLWEQDAYVSTKGFLPGTDSHTTERFTVFDPKFWEREVDTALVNTRGWVLQERILAPRVLHFCRRQIAWECSELTAAECHPRGIPDFQIIQGDLVSRRKLKGLEPISDGKALREARIRFRPNMINRFLLAQTARLTVAYEGSQMKISTLDPDRHLRPEIYAQELWKAIVETYSKMELTKGEDKLIALSGLAKVMSNEIDDEYVAGMWRDYLPSHLLWYVNEQYENGVFHYESLRPKKYRAPSFSWACLNTPKGITYGETTDQDLFIETKEVGLNFVADDNKFGLLRRGCYIVVRCLTIKPVEVVAIPTKRTTRYGWRFKQDQGKSFEERRPYSNVYLDSPKSDGYILDKTTEIFIMPCAQGDRSEPQKYLYCLLLAAIPATGAANCNEIAEGKDEEGHKVKKFRRIGLTKVAPYDKKVQMEILRTGNEHRDTKRKWEPRHYPFESRKTEVWIE